jgi:two-component system NtrC family response regulator
MKHLLIVDDDKAVCSALKVHLESEGYKAYEAYSLEEAREVLSANTIHAVLLDQNLPDGNGIDFIAELKEEWPQISIIVITGYGDIPIAVEAMRRGADYFATKPVYMKDLKVILEKCLEIRSLRKIADLGSRRRRDELFMGDYIRTHCMREAEIAAKSDSPVLIQGETGTGKSLLATWINRASGRVRAPFVHINCAVLKGDLLVSELFGHARGAFTGALHRKAGLLEIADGGTLFMDEIGDLTPEVQSQLLHVLDTKTFRRLGETQDHYSDFRLICATNRNLRAEVAQGEFRQDLFYRISVLNVSLPALRDYLDEIPQLCRHLLTLLQCPHIEISEKAMAALSSYSWPGNVRELRNVIERALLLCDGGTIQPSHLPFGTEFSAEIPPISVEKQIRQMEVDHIRDVISRCEGNMTRAARLLGISRATLYRRLTRKHSPTS